MKLAHLVPRLPNRRIATAPWQSGVFQQWAWTACPCPTCRAALQYKRQTLAKKLARKLAKKTMDRPTI